MRCVLLPDVDAVAHDGALPTLDKEGAKARNDNKNYSVCRAVRGNEVGGRVATTADHADKGDQDPCNVQHAITLRHVHFAMSFTCPLAMLLPC